MLQVLPQRPPQLGQSAGRRSQPDRLVVRDRLAGRFQTATSAAINSSRPMAASTLHPSRVVKVSPPAFATTGTPFHRQSISVVAPL